MEDNAISYFKDNPGNYGWLLVAMGVVLLIGSIRKWKWVFESTRNYKLNLAWIIDRFGFRVAQICMIIFSIFFILLGLAWYALYAYYSL